MRIFKNQLDAFKEMDRELLVQGISVPIKHYQNKKLEGDDQITKELVGVSFLISKPLENLDECYKFMFPKEHETIKAYCEQEFADRTSGQAMNPGNSWKIRQDMWQKFQERGEEFSYTYSERMHNQLQAVVDCLKEDKHSRQAVLGIWDITKDPFLTGGNTRVPCSLDYSFMIRNDRVHTIYHMRSNSFFEHALIDTVIAAKMGEWVAKQVNDVYPEVKPGPLIYFANSLHAYSWNLREKVIF